MESAKRRIHNSDYDGFAVTLFKIAHALTKAGGFSQLRSTFDVYDHPSRTMLSKVAALLLLTAEPWTGERHSSESGSYEAGKISTTSKTHSHTWLWASPLGE